jgi:hypothetical protein
MSVISRSALISCVIVIVIETLLCIFLARYDARRFAFYLSQFDDVSAITELCEKSSTDAIFSTLYLLNLSAYCLSLVLYDIFINL